VLQARRQLNARLLLLLLLLRLHLHVQMHELWLLCLLLHFPLHDLHARVGRCSCVASRWCTG
jgi:hypothetical protein